VARLETGVVSHAALALYRRAGFAEREPFADYGPDPLSVFMEKQLT
jgi:putative acetyltransferase